MLQTLMMMDMVGDRPTTKIVGIIPERVEGTTLQMTEAVRKGSKVMEQVLVKHMKELGFSVEIVKELDIQEIANIACQGLYE